jgi:hypothetical protein
MSKNTFRRLKRNFVSESSVRHLLLRKADCPQPPHGRYHGGRHPTFLRAFPIQLCTNWVHPYSGPDPEMRVSSPFGMERWRVGCWARSRGLRFLTPPPLGLSIGGNIPLSLVVHRLVLPGLERTASRLQEPTLLVLHSLHNYVYWIIYRTDTLYCDWPSVGVASHKVLS